MVKRILVLLLLVICSPFVVMASHIVGGDIYYDYLGNNNYKFYIVVYRDCFSSGAAFDNPLPLGVFSNAGLEKTVDVPYPGNQYLPVQFNNPCATPPSNVCTEKSTYTTIINLPPKVGGYTISYVRCCRGPNITNLIYPDGTGIAIFTKIPGSETGNQFNSSPRFTNYPPLLLCSNDNFIFDHAATDPDGDVLKYSLATPYQGGTKTDPAPYPPPAPPYTPVMWESIFSANAPLGPGSSMTIDPTTGLLKASPKMLGLYVVGIRVQEYRNGVLVSETIRDFLFRVLDCNIKLSANLPEQEELSTFVSYCQGLTVQFENKSFGGTTFAWDFGVPGTTSDVSSAFAPSFTYPSIGTYTAMLVIDPGKPCTDTAYMELILDNPLQVGFDATDSVCFTDNLVDLTGTSTLPNTTFSWTFPPSASLSTATGAQVNNVHFSTTGFSPVTVVGKTANCEKSYTGNVFLYPKPTVSFSVPPNYTCEGLTVPFTNTSTNASDYSWDFGVVGSSTDVSTLQNPSYTFPSDGNYTVTLIGKSTGDCIDTIKRVLDVNQLLTVNFTNNDSLCVSGNEFNFVGDVSGPSNTTYSWNFGSQASPQTSSALTVFPVVFSAAGNIPVTLTAQFDNCVKSLTKSVFLFKAPQIDFSVEPGPFCIPSDVQFTNLSTADTPMSFTWDFGDNSTSTETNPSHLYDFIGNFSVALYVKTEEGCVETLYKMIQDAVVTRPSPTANFTVSKTETTICDAAIQFTSSSQGATKFWYNFDDSENLSSEENPLYNYTTPGTHRPVLIAENEWGCKDTATKTVYIEPFSLFIPNSFTPDGDAYNNIFNGVSNLPVSYWQLSVYNKWGELIFESNDPAVGWSGQTSVSDAQQGTYIFSVTYSSCDAPADRKVITGHINLLR